jgi:hypothetical protein
MANYRTLPLMLACAGIIAAGSMTGAVGAPQGKGKGQERGGPGTEKAQKMHHHKNGHDLLGAKLHQNGKHMVGKFGNRDVTAEVVNAKVVNMQANELAPKRVKTMMKMADAALPAGVQLVQFTDVYYYGYCFDDGFNVDCYWYPAVDVDTGGYWEDYVPPY